jgi:hypothetical protein
LNNSFGNLSIRGLRGIFFIDKLTPIQYFSNIRLPLIKKKRKKGTRSKRFKKQKNQALII